MDHLLFTATSGANRTLIQQQIHANNLANVNTQGFRHDLETAMTQQVTGAGFSSRFLVSSGNGGINMAPGVAKSTGRDLDVAIKGNGLIALTSGNREVYTRNGQMDIGADGELTIEGLPVEGDNGPIILPPYSQITIADDGVITIIPEGGGVAAPIDVDRIKLVDIAAQELQKNENGFLITQATTNPRAEEITVAARHLEGSNVSAINEMVASIALNRQFEAQIKMMKSAEDLANAGNRLLRGS
ncbi:MULTISPECIES: flagellar basal body rod protein FlgF [unclassified Serratia (in: enterobacteria)]|uniref:flagellar basal body rod protein FlgF n=1 Tax=unclassified Serratia (in: enterobacteria) TaxID=2647522 RepID=UPI0005054E0D|nr:MULTISPECIES: flagellar basal body rod protein FlgF [unclassified Serratia (in: enterobacteria)]KFK95347.1 flagellar basal body rod protein FlgF [Serratia sp. Ag2]KFK98695.1 flagellar basal body rod protein FlgF [Serratia sp. Ag1]